MTSASSSETFTNEVMADGTHLLGGWTGLRIILDVVACTKCAVVRERTPDMHLIPKSTY
jgi:hypothetical protein